MDPQQELFTALKIKIEALGYRVEDGALPPEDTPYPFVYLGNMQQVDTSAKDAVFGTVYQTIHVWSNTPKNRGTVSQMMLEIKQVCHRLIQTDNFSWLHVSTNQQIMADDTTKTPLLHGVLEVGFKFG